MKAYRQAVGFLQAVNKDDLEEGGGCAVSIHDAGAAAL